MRILLIFLLFTFHSVFSQNETKTFLLNKAEFKHLEEENTLIQQAFKNAFGEPGKQNPYKLDIKQVDAWNNEVKEFKYYPSADADVKRNGVKSAILNAKENVDLKLRVTLNMDKSSMNDGIKVFLKNKNTIVLNVVVIGNPKTFVKETRDKTDFLELVDENSFADKAFRTFFGDPKKFNYKIEFDKLSACFVKDILEPKCVEKIELKGAESRYNDFSNKITSAEYSACYVLFDLSILRNTSTLNESIEQALNKRKDGSEHLKFYYVIPKDNLRAAKMDIEGRIVNADHKAVKSIMVYLRDNTDQTVASIKTDDNGSFKFEKLVKGFNYSLFIDNTVTENALFITTKKDVVIAEFKKTTSGFEYKLLPADISTLSGMTEVDPSMEFIKSIKGKMVRVSDKIYPIKGQNVDLKNNKNEVLQSQTTDEQGNFEFKNINPAHAFAFDLPGYNMTDKTEKVYMTNAKGDLTTEFKKDQNNIFAYKILPADISLLRYMNEEDVEMEFKKQKSNPTHQVVVRDFIYFDLNSVKISPESKPTLDKIAKILTEHPDFKLEIISHTDSRGQDAENQQLSLNRSASVLTYLSTKKIDKGRLKPLGMGESSPLNNCLDGVSCLEDEFKMNRRTEFKFYK